MMQLACRDTVLVVDFFVILQDEALFRLTRRWLAVMLSDPLVTFGH